MNNARAIDGREWTQHDTREHIVEGQMARGAMTTEEGAWNAVPCWARYLMPNGELLNALRR